MEQTDKLKEVLKEKPQPCMSFRRLLNTNTHFRCILCMFERTRQAEMLFTMRLYVYFIKHLQEAIQLLNTI